MWKVNQNLMINLLLICWQDACSAYAGI